MSASIGAHLRVPADRRFDFFDGDGRALSRLAAVQLFRTIALPEADDGLPRA